MKANTRSCMLAVGDRHGDLLIPEDLLSPHDRIAAAASAREAIGYFDK